MHIPKWLKRTLKWLFGTVITIVLLISGTLYFFHDEIVNYAIGEINKNLKAKVEVSKVDITFWKTFPNLSLDFQNVFVQDALPDASRADTLLYSDMIRLKFNPIDIWNENYKVKSIEINPGTLQLKTDTNGRVNYDIIRSSGSQQSTAFELTLKSIHVHGLRFSYANAAQEQYYSTDFNQLYLKGKFTEKRFKVHTEAAFRINRIANGKIPFVVNQPATTTVDVFVDKEAGTISLPNGLLYLAGLPFKTNVFAGPENVHVAVSAKNLALTDVANKLSVKEAAHVNRFKGSGTASFRLVVDSKTGPDAYPLIDCAFDVRNGRLIEPTQQLRLSQIQVKGNYSTLRGKGKEELNLNTVSFQTIGGPFNGNLFIRKFNAPRFTGKAQGTVDLSILHALFHLPKIDKLQGNVKVDTHFALQTVTDNEGGSEIEVEDGSGTALMKDVSLKLLADARHFKNINGKLILDPNQAALENLSVNLGRSDLLLNGHFDHIDGFLQNKSNLEIAVIAHSNRVDLADFNNNEVPATQSQGPRDWLLPTHIHGQVSLDVGDLILEDHHFNELRANMTVGYRSIVMEQLHGRNAEATVQGTLAVVESAPEYFDMATTLYAQDLHFKPLFKEWHNFEQDVITADNISGKAEVQMNFKAPFDMREGVLKSRIKSQIQLKVTNGNLKNVSAFRELTASLKTPKTRLVLNKQEIEALEGKLNNISFATLENTIYINNGTVLIPSMEIKSSALDITTEGSHTFDNQVDYRFSFRLRDLKIQKDESEFGEVVDDGTGIRVYVRMYGPLDNPTIIWDGQRKKEQQKENREAAKQEAISILKSEFGLFKQDTTVKAYQHQTQPREELRIDFGKPTEDPETETEKKKESKITKLVKEKTNKLKQQQNKEKEPEFIIE